MGVTLSLVGMMELRAALRNLPETLTAEAATIVDNAANQAKAEVYGAYPTGPTGNLKRGLRVTHNAGRRFGTQAIVRSGAPHASIFEFGTQRRTTDRGANRGRMPAAPESEAMIPIAMRVRRRMVRDLVALVRRAGFQVSE